MTADNSAGVGTSAPTTMQRPPLSSGAQISSVEASKDVGASCSHDSSDPMPTKSCPRTSRTIPRCGTTTPLGCPVEPDVNIT